MADHHLDQAIQTMLELQRAMFSEIGKIRNIMGTQALSFNDVKQQVTQLVNDVTGMSNQVAAQIKDVQGALTDLAAKAQKGEQVSQADYQSVIAQLSSAHSLVQQSTAQVQASQAEIQQADPNLSSAQPEPPGPPPELPSQSGPAEGSFPDTSNQTGKGSESETSSSGVA